jgi:hypothetical protein
MLPHTTNFYRRSIFALLTSLTILTGSSPLGAQALAGTYLLKGDSDGTVPKAEALIILTIQGENEGTVQVKATQPGQSVEDAGTYGVMGNSITMRFRDLEWRVKNELYTFDGCALVLPFKALSGSPGSGTSTWIKQDATCPKKDTVTGVIVMNTNLEDDVLFYVVTDEGWRIFYHGFESSGVLDFTHVTIEDGRGNYHVIVFADFVPVQWITTQVLVAVQRKRGERIDPEKALHIIVPLDAQTTEVTIDIYSDRLRPVVSGIESLAGGRLDELRGFLESYKISRFSELVSLAQAANEEQPRYIALAAGFGASAAALRLVETLDTLGIATESTGKGHDRLGQWSATHEIEPSPSSISTAIASLLSPAYASQSTAARYVIGKIAEELLKYGLSQLRDDMLGELFPRGPDMLLCQGASSIPGICHYIYFPMVCDVGCRDAFGCVPFCAASMSCFTNICMPRDGGMTSKRARDLVESLMR